MAYQLCLNIAVVHLHTRVLFLPMRKRRLKYALKGG